MWDAAKMTLLQAVPVNFAHAVLREPRDALQRGQVRDLVEQPFSSLPAFVAELRVPQVLNYSPTGRVLLGPCCPRGGFGRCRPALAATAAFPCLLRDVTLPPGWFFIRFSTDFRSAALSSVIRRRAGALGPSGPSWRRRGAPVRASRAPWASGAQSGSMPAAPATAASAGRPSHGRVRQNCGDDARYQSG